MTPQSPELVDVVSGHGRHAPCPWGLGIETKGNKSPHRTGPSFPMGTAGHFGVSGSFLWADYTHGTTCVFLGTEKSGVWHKEHWSTMNGELLVLVLRQERALRRASYMNEGGAYILGWVGPGLAEVEGLFEDRAHRHVLTWEPEF